MVQVEIDTTTPAPSKRLRKGRYAQIILAMEERAITSGTGHASILVEDMGGIRAACNRIGIEYTSEKITEKGVLEGRERREDIGLYRFWYLGRRDKSEQPSAPEFTPEAVDTETPVPEGLLPADQDNEESHDEPEQSEQ